MTDFKVKGKTVIGLTGSIACGKSFAAAIFKKLGAKVISADELSIKVFNSLLPVIKEHFGTDDRLKIASVIFADKAQKQWLEGKLHPAILQAAQEEIKQSAQNIAVFDVPLLFESGLNNSFDLIVCIIADYDVRLKRALERGLSADDFKQRDAAQTPQEEKIKGADIVFENNNTPEDLEAKITKFYYGLNK